MTKEWASIGHFRNVGLLDPASTVSEPDVSVPLVTIVTPSFNRADFLGDCLASVRLQDYQNVEHIVIDGGSTDGTCELLSRAQSLWNIRFVSEPDNGMYDAIQKGLRMARGQIVGWLNSDDWLLPWAVRSAVEASSFGQTAVHGDVLTNRVGEATAIPQVYPPFRPVSVASGATIGQPAVFWPKWAMETAGMPRGDLYRHVADCDYWFRLSAAVPIRKVREFMAITFDHPDTKREANRAEVASELRDIRANWYHSRLPDGARRISNGLRWRTEWARFLAGRGWTRSAASSAVPIAALRRPMSQALTRRSPLHRHPAYEGSPVDITVFQAIVHERARAIERLVG